MKAHEQLRGARTAASLSQEQAARDLGISLGHYHRIENGKALPSLELASAIEFRYQVPASRWVSSSDYD